MDIRKLEQKACLIRTQILEAIFKAQTGHIGGAFSCTDIIVALYYGGILRFDPNKPQCEGRDKFILSKGHASIALYAVLADLGYFDSSEIMTFCQNGSRLGGHPNRSVPGIEADTGSLGHGLSIGCGLAWCAKIDKKDYKTFVLIGDGECYEGSVWEALMFAAHYELNNLVLIIDRNRQIVMDFTEECIRLDPLSDKLMAFGWQVAEVNGHSFTELEKVFSKAMHRKSSMPLAIIANTTKGKGVSFMEGILRWHHSVPNKEEYDTAIQELTNFMLGHAI